VGRFQQVGAPGHGSGDQRFQALLAGVGGHGAGRMVGLGSVWGIGANNGRSPVGSGLWRPALLAGFTKLFAKGLLWRGS
jgi:hypothetical protein